MNIAPQISAVGPLAGLSVVELGDGTAGPYAAKLLGDFGAEVVKIEGSEGDSSRRRGPFPDDRPDPEASGLFLYLNINKRGVVLDIDSEVGRRALDRLLAPADIFITNLPMARLQAAGVAPAALRARYPRLIVTTITPFGLKGPWAGRRGDELVTYAMAGIAYSTPGMPDAANDLEREPPLHPACFAAETITGLCAGLATLTAVLVHQGRAHVVHAGDSRCYMFRDGQLRQLTDDHSWIAEQLRSGSISEAEAKSSKFRHVITKSIGFERDIEADTKSVPVSAGDCFLLCSDGMSNHVEHGELERIVAMTWYRRLPATLVELANSRGGDDNITVVVGLVANAPP